jgi:hypothetical protein
LITGQQLNNGIIFTGLGTQRYYMTLNTSLEQETFPHEPILNDLDPRGQGSLHTRWRTTAGNLRGKHVPASGNTRATLVDMDNYETLVVRTGTQRYSSAEASTNQSLSSKVEEQLRSARSKTDLAGRCTGQGRHQPNRARWQRRIPRSTASVGRKVRGPGSGRLGARAAQRGTTSRLREDG